MQALDELVSLLIPVGRVLLAAGDDQRCSGFINEDRVDLIDQSHVESSQYSVIHAGYHVVTQIVETKF